MNTVQAGILLPVPQRCRYLTFGLQPGADPAGVLKRLKEVEVGEGMVVGLGQSVVAALGRSIEGLRPFPSLVGPGVDIPATPAALWFWLGETIRGSWFTGPTN